LAEAAANAALKASPTGGSNPLSEVEAVITAVADIKQPMFPTEYSEYSTTKFNDTMKLLKTLVTTLRALLPALEGIKTKAAAAEAQAAAEAKAAAEAQAAAEAGLSGKSDAGGGGGSKPRSKSSSSKHKSTPKSKSKNKTKKNHHSKSKSNKSKTPKIIMNE
jgi:hypothetical protein